MIKKCNLLFYVKNSNDIIVIVDIGKWLENWHIYHALIKKENHTTVVWMLFAQKTLQNKNIVTHN